MQVVALKSFQYACDPNRPTWHAIVGKGQTLDMPDALAETHRKKGNVAFSSVDASAPSTDGQAPAQPPGKPKKA